MIIISNDVDSFEQKVQHIEQNLLEIMKDIQILQFDTKKLLIFLKTFQLIRLYNMDRERIRHILFRSMFSVPGLS